MGKFYSVMELPPLYKRQRAIVEAETLKEAEKLFQDFIVTEITKSKVRLVPLGRAEDET